MYQTPNYEPNHILSPEFGGVSNYEVGINNLINEKKKKLNHLNNNVSMSSEINAIKEDLKTLHCLYENYYIGMNVFRTAKHGRDKLRK